MTKPKIFRAAEPFPHLQGVITAIGNRKNTEKAVSKTDAYFYQLRAAHRVDIFEPFSPEQCVLNEYLSSIQAGRDLCEYAWELYVKKAMR